MPRNYRRRGGALNGQQVRMSPVDFQELHAELQQLLPQTTFAHCAQRSQGGHYLRRDFVLQVGQVFEVAGKRAYRDVEFARDGAKRQRSEEHTSELQSLMRISYAVFCLKRKTQGRR